MNGPGTLAHKETEQGDVLRSAVELDQPAWPTTLEETSETLALSR
jgi:hypothetical protein